MTETIVLEPDVVVEDSRKELLRLARAYIETRNALLVCGERLAKMLAERPVGETQIVEYDGAFYELSRVYSPSAEEVPVRVRRADILGLEDQ